MTNARAVFLLCVFVLGCSRDSAIRNSVDAARAVCCLAHIKQGKAAETAETLCASTEAVLPYILATENVATKPIEVSKDGGTD